jgi:di/tricarboxylate transporter
LELRKLTGLETIDANLAEAGTQETGLVEGIVGPGSRFVGHRLSEFNLRRQFNIHALAIHRQGEALDLTLDSVHFKVGDCLLLEGPTEGFRKLMETGNVVAITEMRERLYNKSRAPIAIGTIAMVMLLSAYNILSIEGAAFLGVLLVYVSGCLSRRDLERAIEWRVLVIIYSMLIVGSAMRLSGAEEIIVGGAAGSGVHINPYVALAAVYLVTILITEVVTNNAAAILVAPIAIGVAEMLGVDPRPFVVAVMFAASASFASPIGYQTNTLVYTAGGYRYVDFLKVGVPLTILFWVLAVCFIPYFWPFAAVQN